MRIQSLIALTAASVIMIGLGAIAGIVAYMSRAVAPGDDVRVAVATKPLDRGCLDCGVVVAIKEVQLKGKAEPVSQYRIRVRMSDGSERTVTYSNPPAWKAGDRVRLLNGRLVG